MTHRPGAFWRIPVLEVKSVEWLDVDCECNVSLGIRTELTEFLPTLNSSAWVFSPQPVQPRTLEPVTQVHRQTRETEPC